MIPAVTLASGAKPARGPSGTPTVGQGWSVTSVDGNGRAQFGWTTYIPSGGNAALGTMTLGATIAYTNALLKLRDSVGTAAGVDMGIANNSSGNRQAFLRGTGETGGQLAFMFSGGNPLIYGLTADGSGGQNIALGTATSWILPGSTGTTQLGTSSIPWGPIHSNRIMADEGTRFLPSHSFRTQGATGMFLNISPFYLGFSVAETETLKLSTTEATVTGNLTASGTVQGNLVSANSGFSSGLDYKINGERFLTYSGTSIVLCPTANGWTDLAIQKPVAVTGNLTASGDTTTNGNLYVGGAAARKFRLNVNSGRLQMLHSDTTSGSKILDVQMNGSAVRFPLGIQSGGNADLDGAAGGATFAVDASGNATINGTIYVGSTANEIWAQYGYLNLRNTGGNGVTIQDSSGNERIKVSGSNVTLTGSVGVVGPLTVTTSDGAINKFTTYGQLELGFGASYPAIFFGGRDTAGRPKLVASGVNLSWMLSDDSAFAPIHGSEVVARTVGALTARLTTFSGYIGTVDVSEDGTNYSARMMANEGLKLGVGRMVKFGPNAAVGSEDSGICRNSAGLLEVNSGTAGVYRDLRLRNIEVVGDLGVAESLTFTGLNNGNSGTTKTIAWGSGNLQTVTLTDNVTFTFTAPPGDGVFQLMVVQDATGGRTVTWPAGIKWAGGAAPTVSAAANAIDIFEFVYRGATYYGYARQNFS